MPRPHNKDKHVIVALGGVTMTPSELRDQLSKLDGALAIKVHPDWVAWMAINHAVDVISEIKAAGMLCFVDRKFDEIPSEVEKQMRLWENLGVDMITAMVSGGVPMLEAAKAGGPQMTLLGVTVLTTKDEAVCERTHGRSIAKTVVDFVNDAADAGADGTVSSPTDLTTMLDAGIAMESGFRVIPNVRMPDGSDIKGDDQNKDRQATPDRVGRLCGVNGAVVMGRPILQAAKPEEALRQAEERYQHGMSN